MAKSNSLRGNNIFNNEEFIANFKNSRIYTELYQKHRDEIIIGIRNSYINLYYNCDNIARIRAKKKKANGELSVEINSYYTKDDNDLSKSTTITRNESFVIDHYERIKKRSQDRKKLEKQAQEKLFLNNNLNSESKWYCIDVEYTRPGKKDQWRFDLIAVSKDSPHRVALIELKYGNRAIGGESGIRKHVKDFHDFWISNSFDELKPEILQIIQSLQTIGVEMPDSISNISSIDELSSFPEFYIITLNDNPDSPKGGSPKQTMGGYLFKKDNNPWNSKKTSNVVGTEGDYYKIIGYDKSFLPRFLFSKTSLDNFKIRDIIEDSNYEFPRPEILNKFNP